MTSATTGPGARLPKPRPYAFPSMQAAAEIDPGSVEVPVGAIDVHGPFVAGLYRPPLRREFLHTLERVLMAGEQVRSWPWGTPSARSDSPEAIVALLAAEGVGGWTARVAQQFRVPPDQLLGPLLARQASWYAERQLDQLLGAEQRPLDRLYGDPSWAALRHLRRGPDGAYFHHFLDATGTAVERRQVAEVVAAHDGHSLRWSWHLDPDARERMRRRVQDLDLKGLRVRIAEAARLLRARPPDPSVTLANAWAVKELLLAEAGRVRARIERYRLDARALPARRRRARRLLQRQVEVEQADLRGLAQRLDQIGDIQDRLDRLRTTRRAWESQPDHVGVLAWGELSAEWCDTGASVTIHRHFREEGKPNSPLAAAAVGLVALISSSPCSSARSTLAGSARRGSDESAGWRAQRHTRHPAQAAGGFVFLLGALGTDGTLYYTAKTTRVSQEQTAAAQEQVRIAGD